MGGFSPILIPAIGFIQLSMNGAKAPCRLWQEGFSPILIPVVGFIQPQSCALCENLYVLYGLKFQVSGLNLEP
jgi:hypothetical protein